MERSRYPKLGRKVTIKSSVFGAMTPNGSHRHRPFRYGGGYLISNYHVVKDATKVRLLTSAGLIDAKVVQADAANDLALLKADGRFACLPIAASRTGLLGGTVATVGFPDIGFCRGSRPEK